MKRFVSCLVGLAVVGVWVGMTVAGEGSAEANKTRLQELMKEKRTVSLAFGRAYNAVLRSNPQLAETVKKHNELRKQRADKEKELVEATPDLKALQDESARLKKAAADRQKELLEGDEQLKKLKEDGKAAEKKLRAGKRKLGDNPEVKKIDDETKALKAEMRAKAVELVPDLKDLQSKMDAIDEEAKSLRPPKPAKKPKKAKTPKKEGEAKK